MKKQTVATATAEQLQTDLAAAREEVSAMRTTNHAVTGRLDLAIGKVKAVLEE